jgi:hypothetical protein
MDTESHETPLIPIRGQALKAPAEELKAEEPKTEEPKKEPGRAAHAAYALMQAGAEVLTRAWTRRRTTWDKLKGWTLEQKPGAEESPPPPRTDG